MGKYTADRLWSLAPRGDPGPYKRGTRVLRSSLEPIVSFPSYLSAPASILASSSFCLAGCTAVSASGMDFLLSGGLLMATKDTPET